MIIAIDASRSTDSIQKTGVERVSDELIQHLVKLAPENVEFIFYTPEKIPWLPESQQKVLKWPFRYLWTQVRLAWEIIFHPPDKLFIPVHKIPFALLLIPYSLPSYYLIIHDIAFKKNPKLYNFWQWLYLNFDLKIAVKKCEKIFVPTQAVKKDLLKYTRVSEDKIIVVHHGYDTKAQKAQKAQKTQKQILYVGRVEEKKNILNLIRGFEIFNKKFPEYKLILAGKIDSKFKMSNACPAPLWCGVKCQMSRNNPSDSTGQANQIQNPNAKKENHNSLFIIPRPRSAKRGGHNSIKFLGYVSEEQKHQLLCESACLALVSKEEGFGLPILEAFDFKLPVLASDIPVLHEIGDGACLFVNPESPEDIAAGLEKIVSDENLRLKLIEKGRGRLKDFSWQKSAQRILQETMK